MVIEQLPEQLLPQLRTLLEQMNVCAKELECITRTEDEAIRNLDAELIMQVSDKRIIAHQCLAQLEQQCQQLLKKHNISSQLTLSVIIDMYAGPQSADFQSLRRNLYERMIKVSQRSQENHLRMHAAYNVSSSILQQLGLSQPEQTYSRR